MDKLYKVIAFGYKALKFCLDIWQIWQFATGGGVVGIVTGIITYFQNKPIWFSVILAIAVGILVACVISLIFKSYTFEIIEGKRLKRIPRLVYDIHRRRCVVREKFIRKIDWGKVDSSKVITPILPLFIKEGQAIVVGDDTLNDIETRLDEIGSSMHGAPSVFTTMMESSDTDLEKAIEKDCHYRVMQARLDSYKPYPSETIRRDIEAVIYGSKVFNDLIVFQSYLSEPISLESLSLHTKLSDIKKEQVRFVNVNIKKIMDINIDKASVRLSEHIEEYLRDKKGTK
jgi:hypothetical protein